MLPKGEPRAAIRQASPPVEPPGVRFGSHGFFVSPQIGLLQPKLQVALGKLKSILFVVI